MTLEDVLFVQSADGTPLGEAFLHFKGERARVRLALARDQSIFPVRLGGDTSDQPMRATGTDGCWRGTAPRQAWRKTAARMCFREHVAAIQTLRILRIIIYMMYAQRSKFVG